MEAFLKSSSTTLEVDRDAREIWNLAAIAVGMNDVGAAFDVCRKLGALEPHYRLALRVGDDVPAERREQSEHTHTDMPARSGSLRRMEAKFPGRCGKCRSHISVGTPIAYDPNAKRAFHEGCVRE